MNSFKLSMAKIHSGNLRDKRKPELGHYLLDEMNPDVGLNASLCAH